MKKQKMRVVCTVAIIGVIAAAICAWVIYKYNWTYSLSESHVQITGDPIDNDYNNYIADGDLVHDPGSLVRIGDKLYYNYFGTYPTYGLYEISSDGARRIYWEGYGPRAWLSGYWPTLYPIREYDGKLYMNTIPSPQSTGHLVYNRDTREWEEAQKRMMSYCEESQTFEDATLFGNLTDIVFFNYQKTLFGYVYESSARADLWVYTEDNGAQKITDEKVGSFYAVGTQIYYLTSWDADKPYTLHVFDWDGKTDMVICQWVNYSDISYFIIEDNYLIFKARDREQHTTSLYTFGLCNPGEKETAIYPTTPNASDSGYIKSWNVWNGTGYLCTDQGLFAIDLNTGAFHRLCDKYVLECDILDDTWVYFIESDRNNLYTLWRVRQTGGDVELVLGQ